MTTLGLIGSGNIGSTVARLAVAAGHDVVLSNSRGPDTLAELVAELGPHARADTAAGAAEAGEIVVVSVPLKAYRDVPVEPLVGKVVIDTNNYYAGRDGQFPELDDGSTTTSELLQVHLPESHVVKAFNNITADHLAVLGRPTWSPDRSSLPIAGDDDEAKNAVVVLLDSLGYGAIDAGPLAEGWRFQLGQPAAGPPYSADPDDWSQAKPASGEEIREALAAARKDRDG